ncbi:bifunctional enoyl-CoA hydratase/phosphate acetyltransferase [Bacteroidota bacterium]
MLKKLSDLNNLLDKSSEPKKLVLAAAEELEGLEALSRAQSQGIIEVILVGDKEQIDNIINKNNINLTISKIIDEKDPAESARIAVKLVHDKKADILMKGNVGTSDLLKAVLDKKIGLRKGELLSHFALFEIKGYHKLLALTDVAINIAPNFHHKIAIINNSIDFLHKLGIKTPKIAAIGAVEMVNENMQATLDAALLAIMAQRKQFKNCIIDGPLAFDNAISKESAIHKKIDSKVAGDADLLFLPDIEVGNVLYKSLVFFAKAQMACVILGASAPIILTSRSDSMQAKLYSILLAAVTA